MKKLSTSRGLTKFETVMIVLIIAVGTFFLVRLINPQSLIRQQFDVRRKADLKVIASAVEQYYKSTGKYPNHVLDENGKYYIKGLNNKQIRWGGSWSPFLVHVPNDPNKREYVYYSLNNGQAYYLYASLEEGRDRDLCNGGKACGSLVLNGIPEEACGGVCNYAVTSANVSP